MGKERPSFQRKLVNANQDAPGHDRWGLSRGFYMTVYFDANNIYDAGTKAMQSSKFKHGTQLFEMNHLLTTAHIRQDFITGDYKPDPATSSRSMSAGIRAT